MKNGYYIYNLVKNSGYDNTWVIANNLNMIDMWMSEYYGNSLIGNWSSNNYYEDKPVVAWYKTT
jgi:hypothetical protein